MFSGLVEARGIVRAIESRPPGVRVRVESKDVSLDAKIGDSIAINGCCLTVVEVQRSALGFDVGPETLQRTNLGGLQVGSFVNLERSLRVGDRLGGHFVTGHIDGMGTLRERVDEKDWSTFWFQMPAQIRKQVASKGSIAIDGVSLTLVDVDPEQFSTALIPHTLEITTLGSLTVGDKVNLESDLLAKYVEKQLQSST
ncbi:MAG: riboflavin synthase [Planctomycetes bacterium]|nr:riboflavin synthase [Planctomycetota bacterium]